MKRLERGDVFRSPFRTTTQVLNRLATRVLTEMESVKDASNSSPTVNHRGSSVKNLLGITLLGLVLFALSGCGYILAGEWKDDGKNWGRAFGGSTPAGIVVHHSYYARMAHFTKEWIYYFKLADSKEARAAIGVNSFLQRTTRTLADLNLDDSRPDWFLRSKLQRVEIYEYPGADSFFAVIDLDSGSIYLHDAQL